MLTRSTGNKRPSRHNISSGNDTDHNNLLSILTRKQPNELEKAVKELADKNNPTLLSIKKVENLFRDHIEFDSRSQLLRELKGSMKAAVLNTIIAHLVFENKLVVNEDRSLTWVDTQGNEKLNKQFDKAASF